LITAAEPATAIHHRALIAAADPATTIHHRALVAAAEPATHHRAMIGAMIGTIELTLGARPTFLLGTTLHLRATGTIRAQATLRAILLTAIATRAILPCVTPFVTTGLLLAAVLPHIAATVGVIGAAILLTGAAFFASGGRTTIIVTPSLRARALARSRRVRGGLSGVTAAADRADHRENEEIHQLHG
jgi:hypothetical protein